MRSAAVLRAMANQPCAIALASQGIMYVVSRGNENNFGSRSKVYGLQAKKSPRICRYGTDPGRALWPNSVALDKQGNVYVSDDWLNRISSDKMAILNAWGMKGSGRAAAGPASLAFDTDDNLYIVDSLNAVSGVFTKDGSSCDLGPFRHWSSRV